MRIQAGVMYLLRNEGAYINKLAPSIKKTTQQLTKIQLADMQKGSLNIMKQDLRFGIIKNITILIYKL